MQKLYFLRTAFIAILLFLSTGIYSQVVISGTVYDITKKNPIEAVSVLTASGKGTVTDSLGRYSIYVSENDSIFFSFLNKPTPKYPVRNIQTPENFDISILVKGTELPNVTVKQKNYKLDSMQNREVYKKVFNFKKPGLTTSMNPAAGPFGVGLDLDELINMFRFRKNRRTLVFQKRLVQQEQDNYIDHRYSKALVRRLTGITSPELESFMAYFRPTYELSIALNDLEFGHMVIQAYKVYKNHYKAAPAS